MVKVVHDLKVLKKKAKKEEVENRYDEKMSKMKTAMEWFRNEALKNSEIKTLYDKERSTRKRLEELAKKNRKEIQVLKVQLIDKHSDNPSSDLLNLQGNDAFSEKLNEIVSPSKRVEVNLKFMNPSNYMK